MMRRLVSFLLLSAAGGALLAAGPVSAQSAQPEAAGAGAPASAPVTLPLGLLPGAAAASQSETPRAVRHILPPGGARLSGEMAKRSWTVTLPEEGLEDAMLQIGYENAVMVAPESSTLRVSVNGTEIGTAAIRSSSGITDLALSVPNGVLVPGRNSISMQASQRHRTDCTPNSTYELWTELDPRRTVLTTAGPAGQPVSTLHDIAAIGPNSRGETSVAVLAPELSDPAVAETLIALAQKLAILTRAAHLSFEVVTDADEMPDQAALTLTVGTHERLKQMGVAAPSGTTIHPGIVGSSQEGVPHLHVSAPSLKALRAVLDDWTWPTAENGPQEQTTWPATNAPLLGSGESIDFAGLGIPTERFSGRRYSQEFSIAVPPDFYAQHYGEATIKLDAALSREVQPGSRIDVYVNDRIASTVPILDSGGGVLRQLPIRVSLREMRPGPNLLRLEAVMISEADAVCAPGTTASETPRFAIYDTSRIVMPDYAQIAQRPDLAAFVAAGQPYEATTADAPMPLVLGLQSGETIAAAMNVMGRMAASAREVRPVSVVTPTAELDTQSALFVSPAANLSPTVRDHVRLAPPQDTGWAVEKTIRLALGRDRANELDEWRESLETSPIRRQFQELSDTLNENFDLSLAALRLVPGEAELFYPDEEDTLVVVQAASPGGTGTWTVVTAPSPEALRDGSADLAQRANWQEVSGRLSVYSASAGSITNLPPMAVDLVPTQPLSLSNTRLIVTNWMSGNALAYSLALALACVLLGGVTLALLSQLGRRP
ncbi:MAG: cellulose biosynthesis cyclic di-GMP-binding regulatory protein BcsB [Pseudomonadota bacterium]